MSQESFEQQDAAEKFGQLVDRLGGEAARAIREKRNAAVAPTLAEFTTSFLDPSQGHLSGVTPGTRYGYRQIADNSFIKFLGQLPIDAITNQDVARWIAWQEKVPSTRFAGQLVAAKTVRNCHGLLSTILNAAVAAKLIDHNPAKGTSLLRGRRQGVSFLTQNEFDTLLHFIPERDRPLVLMLAGTGMRWGEATAITWGDIDPTSNPALLTIDKAWKKAERSGVVLGPPKTHRGNRTISLWPELVEALGPRGNSADLVFRGARNVSRVRSPRFHEHSWTPAVDAANDAVRCGEAGLTPIGKRPRIHDLRHTHASWLIAAGVPLPYIQQRLGHENISTTVDLYGHMLPDMQNATAQAASQAMSGAFKHSIPTKTPSLSN